MTDMQIPVKFLLFSSCERTTPRLCSELVHPSKIGCGEIPRQDAFGCRRWKVRSLWVHNAFENVRFCGYRHVSIITTAHQYTYRLNSTACRLGRASTSGTTYRFSSTSNKILPSRP